MAHDTLIEVGQLVFHYRHWGTSDHQPILLLHGFLSQAHIWNNFALHICSHYHVLALDQRGHGESEWARDGAYSLDDHFSDISTFIELLDLKDLIIIGHSMGGRNALFYTACAPERIKGLVLVDARPGNTEMSMAALKDLLDGFRPEPKTLNDFVQGARSRYPHLSLKNTIDIINSGCEQVSDKLIPRYDPALIRGVELAGYMVEELWPFMEGIICPTLVIRGERSTFLSRHEAEMMSTLIPKGELVEIPRTSHLPMLENAAAFKKAVLSFLDQLSSV